MANYQDQIKDLEKEISETKYNKKTQHHIGLVKAKLAKLKEKEMSRGGGGGGEGYAVRKSGDATVILLGFPSVGKSTLLNGITNANSEVGAYAFTTLTVIPGLMEYKNAQIQVLDVPGIVQGAASGRGRGREVLSTMRSADLILILLDVNNPEHYELILKEVYDSGIRINQKKPDVKIIKTSKDGLDIGTTIKLTKTTPDTLKSILKEFKINNAQVVIRDDITVDQFIDVIEGNKVYIPSITVINKKDTVTEEQLKQVTKKVKAQLAISAHLKFQLDELKDLIFDSLHFIRIFCKEAGKPADMDIPIIMRTGDSVESMCNKLHKDFVSKFKFSKIWGPSAKFGGQKQHLKHKLADQDIVEIHTR